MHHSSRFLAAFLTLLLIMTACAPAPTPTIAPPAAQPTVVPTVISPTATAVPITYESSLPAVLWGENNKQHLLFPLDPSSGEALPGYTPISLGRNFSYAFSPDRRTLAAAIFPNESAHDGSLLLIDLSAWKTQRFDLKLEGWVGAMAFRPDGGQLVISHGDEQTSRLTLFDLKQQAVVIQGETDLLYPRLKFASGGNALMLYGLAIKDGSVENQMAGGTPQVLLLDAATLSPRWRATLDGVREGIFAKDGKTTLTSTQIQEGQAMYLSPGVAFAPDRDALYIVHADSRQLTTADFGAQKVQTVDIHARLSWFEQLLSLTASIAHAKVTDGTNKQIAVSPDGRFLYVVGMDSDSTLDKQGNWQLSQTPLGLEIIQTSDGSRVQHIQTSAAELSLSPDGRFLYLRNWALDQDGGLGTEVFDTSSHQIVASKVGLYLTPTLSMNGEPLLASTYSLSESLHHMTVLLPDDLSVLGEWKGAGYIAWLTPQ